jgi:hypothetical protein
MVVAIAAAAFVVVTIKEEELFSRISCGGVSFSLM